MSIVRVGPPAGAATSGVVAAASYAVGDGVTDAATGIAAAIAAVAAGDVIDLGNRTYLLGSTINLAKAVTFRNGSFTAAGRRCFTVSAAARFERVTFTRTTTTRSDEGSVVYVQAEDFVSVDCTYTSAAGSCLVLKHALANGAQIRGGACYPQFAFQDVSGIYVAAGASRNLDILIDGVAVRGNGVAPDGIKVYNASRCTVRNCVVDNCTQLPNIPITSGWTLVSGNVYQITDRTDGTTRFLLNGGTSLSEDTTTPTTPASNKWGVSGGVLYINLAGTNPNTVTITSGIVSGYGIMLYGTVAVPMVDNRIENNVISNTDGFGIYYQLFTSGSDGRRNSTLNNQLTDVCRTGLQNSQLPFAGIGVTGGFESSFVGDRITNAGVSGHEAPGFHHYPIAAGDASGTVIGMQVTGATRGGIVLPSGKWKFIGCRANNNTGSGFATDNGLSTDVVDAELLGCEATGNTVHGVNADASVTPGSTYRVNIIGGLYCSNGSRNIAFKSVRDSRIVGATCYSPGTSQYNILINTGCQRVIVDGCCLKDGNGIQVDASAIDTVVGANTFTNSSSPLLLGGPVRIAGMIGAGAEWAGSGTPEGAVAASVGATYRRLDGGAGTTLYVKESGGTGSSGWIAK